MRIAFYAPLKPPDHQVPSGDRLMARLLIKALTLAGHRVEVVSTLRSHCPRPDEAAMQAIGGAAEAEVRRLGAAWRQPRSRPDLWLTYHLYYKAPDLIGPPLTRQLQFPYVVVEPSHAPKRAGGPWHRFHQAAEAAIRQARAVACVTRHDMACVAPLIADTARLVHLPPFLDAAAMFDHARPDRAALARRHGLDPGRRWLLAVAMMRAGDKLASFADLGAALALLPGDDWSLLVAGAGDAEAQVRRALAAVPVCYLGAVAREALPALYCAADLYVWPARGEAYGMSFLEAAAAGLPVVAGNERGVPDVVRDGLTGLLVAPGDAAEFAGAVRRLLDDPDLSGRMSAAGRRFALEERSIAGAARQLDELVTWAQN